MVRASFLVSVCLLLSACASIPGDLDPLPEQWAHPPAESGLLADMEDSIHEAHGEAQSGFWLLDKNRDALDWRLALFDSAESSLDVLYYLWYAHDSGKLVMQRIIEAADRGVKVRLLVDDLLLIGGDKGLVGIDRHPNIQLRLFNPKRQRKAGMVVDSVIRFKQMNARTHNKLIVADNRAVILGGRNIGDYYFGLSSKYNFHDLDVMGFGPVARQSSELFDNFWNSSWVVSASDLPASISDGEISERRSKLLNDVRVAANLENFSTSQRDWTEELGALLPDLHVGSSQVIFDRIENGELVRGMVDPLGELMRSADRSIDVVNAYIIPQQDFIDGISDLVDRGISIRILTNSLASHDVPAVNSHYKKWRKPIVGAGAELYELRADPAVKARVDTPPVKSKFTGLHTKSIVVDGDRVFIGSMNFDPRSVNINTEMGIIIESDTLGDEMVRLADRDMAPENAWQVMLDDNGEVTWVNSDETVTRQPARNGWQRVMDGFFRILPKSQF